LIKYFTSNWK